MLAFLALDVYNVMQDIRFYICKQHIEMNFQNTIAVYCVSCNDVDV